MIVIAPALTLRVRSLAAARRKIIADALHHPYLLGNKFLIVGHTEARGSHQHNLELSQKRASAIRETPVTAYRIPAVRVEAVGLGEEQYATRRILTPLQNDGCSDGTVSATRQRDQRLKIRATFSIDRPPT
jgi:hypothetical protein